ncbi:MAG TPA: hypothetical protein VMV69_05590 [Pirellulales bacterium]|nr:hypothetical protein [Pirellulales bacterium]
MTPDDESGQFEWRETYFVLFQAAKQPLLKDVETAVKRLDGHFRMTEPMADDDGRIESLNVVSPEDHSALEIDYLCGTEVVEQVAQLTGEIRKGGDADREKLKKLRGCDARFEVMHFEEMVDGADEDDETFDPSALLVLLDALVELTDGVGVDPQSGSLL